MYELDDLPPRYRAQALEQLGHRPAEKRPAPTARVTPEKVWQARVLAIAKRCNWWAFHVHDSRRSEPGFPDLVLVRGPDLIFVELKSETVRLSAAQVDVIDRLRGAGQQVFVVEAGR